MTHELCLFLLEYFLCLHLQQQFLMKYFAKNLEMINKDNSSYWARFLRKFCHNFLKKENLLKQVS